MKPQIAVWLFVSSILMLGCKKDDQLAPEKVKPNLLSNTLNTEDVDEVTGSLSDIALGNDDVYQGAPGVYWNFMDGEILSGVAYYYGKIEVLARFRTRNLSVKLTIPYQYDYKRSNGRVYKIGPAAQGDGNAVLSFVGTHGDIVGEQTYSSVATAEATSLSQVLETEGNVTYNCAERRTIIKSMNGRIKVEAGFKAEIFEVGAEIEEGFTVQSAINETGAHSGDAYFTLKVPVSGWTIFYPNFQRTISLYGAFYGTIHD